jgi:hypothetical protein
MHAALVKFISACDYHLQYVAFVSPTLWTKCIRYQGSAWLCFLMNCKLGELSEIPLPPGVWRRHEKGRASNPFAWSDRSTQVLQKGRELADKRRARGWAA